MREKGGETAKTVGDITAGIIAVGMALGACTPRNPVQGGPVDPTGTTKVPMTETIQNNNDVVINSNPISFTAKTELGVDGVPYAIPQGGIVSTNEFGDIVVSYNGGPFQEVSWLKMIPDGQNIPEVGQILPYVYTLPDSIIGKKVHLVPYNMSQLNREGTKEYTFTQRCIAVPMVVTGDRETIMNGIEPYLSKGFPINPDNMAGADNGYLSWVILAVGDKDQDGLTHVSVQGIVSNGGVTVLRQHIPDDVISRYNLDNE